MKPFADGKIIKECLTAVAKIAFPDRTNVVSIINLSRSTVARWIEDLSEDIFTTPCQRITKLEYSSLALDVGCDISDVTQLSIYIRGIDVDYNITEELCSPISMKETTTRKDMYDEL